MTCRKANEQPLVSVIVPAFNRAGIIRDTIANIFEQTYKNIELIVVDDGSTDDTAEILKSYGSRLRWAVQKNAGPSAARNRGVTMAKGEIIAFQDSDDTWHPSKIARQVSLLVRGGESIVCCICNCTVEMAGRTVSSFENAPMDPPMEEGIWLNPAQVLITRFILFNQVAAIRRNVLERIGGFDESFRLLEDMDLALRLALEGPWAFIREPLATRQDKLPLTLQDEATPKIVSENELRIREKIFRIVESKKSLASLLPMMKRELAAAARRARAVRMRNTKKIGPSLLGWSIQRWEHYRMAVYRRTPRHTKMKVERA